MKRSLKNLWGIEVTGQAIGCTEHYWLRWRINDSTDGAVIMTESLWEFSGSFDEVEQCQMAKDKLLVLGSKFCHQLLRVALAPSEAVSQ